MNRTILWILGVVAVFFVVFAVVNNQAGPDTQPPGDGNEPVAYFQQKMVDIGVEKIGQPIEGFNASGFMEAFAGLQPADFADVETKEGHYEVADGEVTFVRDTKQPVTSAEQMISDEGYATLLENISTRLELSINNKADIDTLIERISE